MERIARLDLVVALVQWGGLQDKNAAAIRDFVKSQEYVPGIYNDGVWHVIPGDSYAYERMICFRQLHCVFRAIDKWYADHDGVLPESLGALIEGGYLAEFPEHPFTGALMEYHRDAHAPSGLKHNDVSSGTLGMDRETLSAEQRAVYNKMTDAAAAAFLAGDSRYTYLRLGRRCYLILEPTPEESTPEEEIWRSFLNILLREH